MNYIKYMDKFVNISLKIDRKKKREREEDYLYKLYPEFLLKENYIFN